jgi:hypothetical protein
MTATMTDCPYAKSDMTPCVRRDGPMCFAIDSQDRPICVGCARSPDSAGVPFPPDWEKTVAEGQIAERLQTEAAMADIQVWKWGRGLNEAVQPGLSDETCQQRRSANGQLVGRETGVCQQGHTFGLILAYAEAIAAARGSDDPIVRIMHTNGSMS